MQSIYDLCSASPYGLSVTSTRTKLTVGNLATFLSGTDLKHGPNSARFQQFEDRVMHPRARWLRKRTSIGRPVLFFDHTRALAEKHTPRKMEKEEIIKQP